METMPYDDPETRSQSRQMTPVRCICEYPHNSIQFLSWIALQSWLFIRLWQLSLDRTAWLLARLLGTLSHTFACLESPACLRQGKAPRAWRERSNCFWLRRLSYLISTWHPITWFCIPEIRQRADSSSSRFHQFCRSVHNSATQSIARDQDRAVLDCTLQSISTPNLHRWCPVINYEYRRR